LLAIGEPKPLAASHPRRAEYATRGLDIGAPTTVAAGGVSRIRTIGPVPPQGESAILSAAMASILQRFRRLSPPGAAMAGVAPPVDPEAARAAELAPVFGTLDAVQFEVDAILAAARVEADRIRAQAAADAESRIARAKERSLAAKARVSQQRIERSASEREQLIARGRAEAAAIRESGDLKAAAVASAVLQQLRSLAKTGEVDR
jgi:hypothetical protein